MKFAYLLENSVFAKASFSNFLQNCPIFQKSPRNQTKQYLSNIVLKIVLLILHVRIIIRLPTETDPISTGILLTDVASIRYYVSSLLLSRASGVLLNTRLGKTFPLIPRVHITYKLTLGWTTDYLSIHVEKSAIDTFYWHWVGEKIARNVYGFDNFDDFEENLGGINFF